MAKNPRMSESPKVSIQEDSPNRTSFTAFQKTVASAGTPEQLHASLAIPDGYSLVIKAMNANTGKIKIGATSTAFGTACFQLEKDQSITLRITNANLVYIDATVNGEGVECLVET